jgi:hypothetical protein
MMPTPWHLLSFKEVVFEFKLKIKNEKLKSQNGSCILRTVLLTLSAEKKGTNRWLNNS